MWLADLSDAQEKEPPGGQWHGAVAGLIDSPRSGGAGHDVRALHLGESVTVPDGRDKGGSRAGVDLLGGQGSHYGSLPFGPSKPSTRIAHAR